MPERLAPPPVPYNRILAVKVADLGDLLTVTPALQALRAAHPTAQIDLLVPPSSASLLQGVSYINRIVTFDKFAFDSLRGLLDVRKVVHTLRFLLRLRTSGYGALAIFHHFTTRWGSVKFAILALASGATVRAGLDNGRGHFLTRKTPDKGFGVMHEADYWLQVAALLGADPYAGWPADIPISNAHRAVATDLLAHSHLDRDRRPLPLVAIHPGAGGYSRARIWPAEGFAEVARDLISSRDASIIILGGPDEVETAANLETLISDAERVLNLAGRTTIHETAAVIELCNLFVGNDSGPMHIAAAVKTPVVAIFGPSNQRAWGPYTPPGQPSHNRIVSRDLPCMPCFYRAHSLGLREGCGPRPCLTSLPAEQVIAACVNMIRENQQSL